MLGQLNFMKQVNGKPVGVSLEIKNAMSIVSA